MRFLRRLFERVSDSLVGRRVRPEATVKSPESIDPTPPISESRQSVPQQSEIPPLHMGPDGVVPLDPEITQKDPDRDPYFIQVGLDFGTSYCKCVWRDMGLQKAWVYIDENPADPELPFLMPSALQIRNGKLCMGDPGNHYQEHGLPHIKIALVKVALGEWGDPVLKPFLEILGENRGDRVKAFVVVCAVYLLAGVMGSVKASVRRHLEDFGAHSRDYFAVNVAVPVADAEKTEITSLFRSVIDAAYERAELLGGHPEFPLQDLPNLIPRQRAPSQYAEESGPCFLYPEVSAGVQAFVQSRVSKNGVYFFSDTGAATVDQSFFILHQQKGRKQILNYLSASVISLGSSRIEAEAAISSGDTSAINFEKWRKLKEATQSTKHRELELARMRVGERLSPHTLATLFDSFRKLSPKQFRDVRVIFAGGGHANNPYGTYTLSVFDEKQIGGPFTPQTLGMPIPRDLEPADEVKNWIKRLWVAYGLAFWSGDYPEHRYPGDTPSAPPPQPRKLPDVVSKEMC